ncbi:MAG: 3-dehydroquinate synthase [Clostridiales bacterium]|jgi:3-dehydroquinate synthase|nr:3-dehydroquinate synthase [Clostridiales bacterium]
MTLTMNLGENTYDILVKRGILNTVGDELNLNRRVFIATDDGVPEEYIKKISSACKEYTVFTLPSGEESKNIENYSKMLSAMVNSGLTRADCVVAVGGGVTGDLSGFAASTYMRGIDFYNIPTTLLSQIDSSIGGKTGIDFVGFKNLVGTFNQPKKVVIDPDVLNTLPKRQISNGLAEAIKMAATCDAKLFELLETVNYRENMNEIIVGSLKIKRAVVEKDEREAGPRRVLNFGHTVGHAIESTNKNLLHGECVALGMIPMCSESVRKRLKKVLEKAGLPTEFEYDTEKLINAIAHDKKVAGNQINLVYVEEIGSFKLMTIPLENLISMLVTAFAESGGKI